VETARILAHLLIPAALTAVLECLFWFLAGYRQRPTQLFIAVINLASNLTLNVSLSLIANFFPSYPRLLTLAALEISVVLAEFLLLVLYLMPGRREKVRLFVLTFAANFLTCAAGLIVSGSYYFA